MSTDRRNAHDGDVDTVATAIGLYALGEISLGKAAEHADMTRWEMEELLDEAGIEIRRGPRTKDEAEAEVEAALDFELE